MQVAGVASQTSFRLPRPFQCTQVRHHVIQLCWSKRVLERRHRRSFEDDVFTQVRLEKGYKMLFTVDDLYGVRVFVEPSSGDDFSGAGNGAYRTIDGKHGTGRID